MLKKMCQLFVNSVWMTVVVLGTNTTLLAQSHRQFLPPTTAPATGNNARYYEWYWSLYNRHYRK